MALALGIALRLEIFDGSHREGDEKIYAALVEQVRSGRGYTLRGHPILVSDWMVREQYDVPLFYHPPAGILLFAAFAVPLGDRGLDVAQLAAFAVFLGSTLLLAREVLPTWGPLPAAGVALIGATTPIVVHVSMHRWLDGPQVAAVALAAWLLARAARRPGPAPAVVAGLALGLACLVKMSSVLAVPGAVALAWASADRVPPRTRARALAIAFGTAGLVVLPWLVAELRAYGTIFPAWAGRPSARLVAENPFVRQVTAVRSPWAYLRLLPQTMFTLLPSLGVLAIARPSGRAGRVAVALSLWIAVVVGANMALGAIGYSKLLRYVVLVEPAAALLAVLAFRSALAAVSDGKRALGGLAVAVLAAALALQLGQAAQTAIVYPDRAWIRPLIGEAR